MTIDIDKRIDKYMIDYEIILFHAPLDYCYLYQTLIKDLEAWIMENTDID